MDSPIKSDYAQKWILEMFTFAITRLAMLRNLGRPHGLILSLSRTHPP